MTVKPPALQKADENLRCALSPLTPKLRVVFTGTGTQAFGHMDNSTVTEESQPEPPTPRPLLHFVQGQWSGAWCVLLFLFTALAVYAPALGPWKFIFGTDTYSHDYIMHLYGWEKSLLSRGELPLWCPYMFCGFPFIASAALCPFYPTQWLYFILPFNTSFTLQYVLALVIGGTGFTWWMRKLGLTRTISVWAGLMFIFSGHFLTLTYAGHLQKVIAIAWAPVALGAMVVIGRRSTYGLHGKVEWLRACILLGTALGMQLLASHPQIFYATAIACFAHAAAIAICRIEWRSIRPGAGGVALGDLGGQLRPAMTAGMITLAACVFAACISAVQLFPAMEMAGVSNRADGVTYQEAIETSYPPTELIEYLIPRVFGDSVRGTKTPYFGGWGERIVSDYIGIPLFLLAIAGAVFSTRKYRIYLAAALVVSLMVGLGRYTPLYRILYIILPGFKSFRSPGSFMFIADLACIALGAMGIETLIAAGVAAARTGWKSLLQSTEVEAEPVARPRPWITSVASKSILSGCALAGVLVAAVAMNQNWGVKLDIATEAEYRHYHMYRGAFFGGLHLAVACTLLLFIPVNPRLFAAGIAAAGLALPVFHNRYFVRFEPLPAYLDYLRNQPALLAAGQSGPHPVRILEEDRYALKSDQMLSNVGTPGGYHPITLRAYELLATVLGIKSDSFGQQLVVSHARTYNGKPPEGGPWVNAGNFRKSGRQEFLWRRNTPVNYFKNGLMLTAVDNGVKNESTALAGLLKTPSTTASAVGPDASGEETAPAAPVESTRAIIGRDALISGNLVEGFQRAQAALDRWTPHRINIRTAADAAGTGRHVLVGMAELDAPGWQAKTSAGDTVPLVRYNVGQRAMALPHGTFDVIMEYKPYSFRIGCFLSLLAVMILVLSNSGAMTRFVQRFKSQSDATSAEPAQ